MKPFASFKGHNKGAAVYDQSTTTNTSFSEVLHYCLNRAQSLFCVHTMAE